ncbi:Serpin B7 [Thelohanellus kitauei]|uniref:Serpin B7 n=1 Tax=Thelohanellus kitauei TaxID=669202 RepID=A0A0C2N4Y0_THEKT|nr:Serpin B7 [Thelohanellus kitauei]
MSAEAVNRFTFNILNHLYVSQNASGNIAFGGISLYVLMGIINFGLKGPSCDQLSQFIGEKCEEKFTGTWTISNTAKRWRHLRDLAEELRMENSALFCSYDVNYQFELIADLIFSLHIKKLDFSNPTKSVHEMNSWIYYETYGMIKNIFNESTLTENMIMLFDVVFFHADWRTKFKPGLTKNETFYDDNANQYEVSMMNQESYHRVYDLPENNFRILFKDFTYPTLFSAIVLPRDGHRIVDVFQNFKVFFLLTKLDQMPAYFNYSTKKYVKLKLPKLNILSRNDLVATMIHFGIKDIFDKDHSNFGRMMNNSVYVGNLMQVTNLAIDELGVNSEEEIEDMVEESIYETDEFYVTRPFLFFVYSYSGEPVLFSAIVTNPKAA